MAVAVGAWAVAVARTRSVQARWRKRAVMAGDVDVFSGYPAPENLAQFQADPTFQVLVGSTEGETILATNNARPPFDNTLVRQALAHAIDRQSIIDGAAVNGSARIVGWLAGVVRGIQSGFIYHYAFAMIVGVALLVWWFVPLLKR